MKKYIAALMVASMATSLIPAQMVLASGADILASASIIGAASLTEGQETVGIAPGFIAGGSPASASAPELRLRINDTMHLLTSSDDIVTKFTLSLTNAEFKAQTSEDGETPVVYDDLTADDFVTMVTILNSDYTVDTTAPTVTVAEGDFSSKEVTFTLTTDGGERGSHALAEGNYIVIDLASVMNRVSTNSTAVVTIDSDDIELEENEFVYATIVKQGFYATIKSDNDVAPEENVVLDYPIKVKETVAGSFQAETPSVADSDPDDGVDDSVIRKAGTEFTFKISKGFAFVSPDNYTFTNIRNTPYDIDTDEFTVEIATTDGKAASEFSVDDIKIEATTAKEGDVATVRISSSGMDTMSLEVATVVDYTVALSVDRDLSVPVMYNSVDTKSTGLNINEDNNTSLEVTIEESFPGAWSMRDGFQFTLPEGVFVTDVNVTEASNFTQDEVDVTPSMFKAIMAEAYVNGEYEEFNFKRRVFDDVNHTLATEKAKVVFELSLVAEPDFEGEVELGFQGSLVDTQSVVIAEFISPYVATAQQNDVIIDYRNTKIESDITVTEWEAGLLSKGSSINFTVDRGDIIQFESGATFVVSEDSDMEIKGTTDVSNGTLSFTVTDESYDIPADIAITDMELFMQRTIPAGVYNLTVSSSMEDAMLAQDLFGTGKLAGNTEEDTVGDFADYSKVVNEAFVNVVTAGSDKDNLFTTKIVVPIGENYITAGTKQIELDVPAYISSEGYTMLPVRVVANALGVDTNSVLWNGETRSVTIMYGQRIITMTIGAKTITINGSEVPASASPEIVNGRTFLPLRDLAVALGVTDIHWNPTTRVATLNGGDDVLDSTNEEVQMDIQ
ncbi:MAG: copper amine oxidase N-terminal domain-containing protein [Bacillota bacterium]